MATGYEKEAFGSSRDGVNFSADANDGFSNASVVGGDNRNDEPTLRMGQSLGGGRFVGNQTAYNLATYGQNTRPSYSQKNLSPTQRNNLMQQMGITMDNPYGFQNRFSDTLGIDPKNLSYPNLSPQKRQGIMQLTLDRYLDPTLSVVSNPNDQLRPGMRAGDITRFGTVESVPKENMNTLEKLFSNTMIGSMFGIGKELVLTEKPGDIPASASVAGEDPRYTPSGGFKVNVPGGIANYVDSVREKFNRPPEFDVSMDADATVSYTPGQRSSQASTSSMVSDMTNYFAPNVNTGRPRVDISSSTDSSSAPLNNMTLKSNNVTMAPPQDIVPEFYNPRSDRSAFMLDALEEFDRGAQVESAGIASVAQPSSKEPFNLMDLGNTSLLGTRVPTNNKPQANSYFDRLLADSLTGARR
jgi:hypothetical protein